MNGSWSSLAIDSRIKEDRNEAGKKRAKEVRKR
jgi:hypothetical protein